jgi:hypothetical protein
LIIPDAFFHIVKTFVHNLLIDTNDKHLLNFDLSSFNFKNFLLNNPAIVKIQTPARDQLTEYYKMMENVIKDFVPERDIKYIIQEFRKLKFPEILCNVQQYMFKSNKSKNPWVFYYLWIIFLLNIIELKKIHISLAILENVESIPSIYPYPGIYLELDGVQRESELHDYSDATCLKSINYKYN